MKRVAPLLTLLLASPALAKWPADAQPLGTAVLAPASGSKVQGTVDFAKTPKGLLVRATVGNLSAGQHGFHVHEKGDCSAADASSAGEHYNPTAAPHGGPSGKHRHLGDLGNLSGGKATRTVEILIANPAGTPPRWEDLIGRALIVHEKADDLKTDPSGNSGARIGCGVITAPLGRSE